jgi:hypothetical protein
LSLTDDLLAPQKFAFPSSAPLLPGGFLVVWCDNETSLPGLHTGFTLSADGETLWLLRSASNGLTQLDQLSYGLQVADRSVGRFPDGTGAWQLTVPTPSGPNHLQALGSPRGVKINEWMADPAGGPDWFELFNPELLPVSIGGLSLTDDPQYPTNSPVPALSFLDGWSWRQFFADNQLELGANHVGFKLSASGEAIGLYDANGMAIDAVAFGAQAQGVSQGRLPDGSDTIVSLLSGPTPGQANVGDADGDRIPDNWETAHGLNPHSSDDAAQDADGDGQSNFQEFLAGTDPQNAHDYLRIERVEWVSNPSPAAKLRFLLRAGNVYELQYREALTSGVWQTLTSVGPEAANRSLELLDSDVSSATNRFYRIVLKRSQVAR